MYKIISFDEYTYFSERSGITHHPYYVLSGPNKGKWFSTGVDGALSLGEIGEMFNIPEDEQIILKLKYGCGKGLLPTQ